MFLYRPHVHGLEAITTPDLILDQALASDVWSTPRSGPISAAWVVVAARYAPLITVGLIEAGRPWLIARSAWRLTDLDPQWSGLSITFASAPGDAGRSGMPRPGSPAGGPMQPGTTSGEAVERLSGRAMPSTARGIASFVPIGAAPIADPAWCRVTLVDARLDRTLVHEVRFSPYPESHQ